MLQETHSLRIKVAFSTGPLPHRFPLAKKTGSPYNASEAFIYLAMTRIMMARLARSRP